MELQYQTDMGGKLSYLLSILNFLVISPITGFCDEFAFRSSSSISETVKEDSMLWNQCFSSVWTCKQSVMCFLQPTLFPYN